MVIMKFGTNDEENVKASRTKSHKKPRNIGE